MKYENPVTRMTSSERKFVKQFAAIIKEIAKERLEESADNEQTERLTK